MQQQLMDQFQEKISADLYETLNKLFSDAELPPITLELPPDLEMGDFAFPCFRLAKQCKKAPQQIAQALQQHLPASAEWTTSIAGAYLNFHIRTEILHQSILPALVLSKEKLGHSRKHQGSTVLLEYSSPNVAKPFNIYHLRTTMLGNSLHRIHQARGFKTVCINHIGDWGTQYGALAIAYQRWGNDDELEKRGIPYLVELYVRINKAMETEPGLKDQAREAFSKLENHDSSLTALWKKFVDLSLKEFQKTYDRLGVHFDYIWGESHYVPFIPELEKELTAKGLLTESEGAWVVLLEEENMPACIIRKKDGSTIYSSRDLAAAIHRHKQFQFNRCLYVVGAEQKLHFQQVFKVLEKAGYAWAKNCVHVDCGLYRFQDAKMSTRKGNFVTMESVLDAAVEEVREIMQQKGEVSESDAEAIGVGAIIFHDLSTDRNSDVQFDLEKILDFDGETGPYIQYAHTRCLSILRNASFDTSKKKAIDELLLNASSLTQKEELHLLRILGRLPLVLELVIATAKPHHLANYLIDVTKHFNAFYRAHKVLTDNASLTQARLSLVLATQQTLLQGLRFLGINVPQKM